MNENLLCCETCGVDSHSVKTPIFEKPFRIAMKSDMKILEQNTNDHRKQENICLDCFTKEISELSKECKTRYEIEFHN